MSTCATCSAWSLKASPLARANMAPCTFGDRWTYLPPQSTCARHKPVEPAAAQARAAFLANIEKRHKAKS